MPSPIPDTGHPERRAAAGPAAAGLSRDEVARLRHQFGWNELPRARRVSWGGVLARQFTNFLVVILIGAAIIAYVLGDRIDTLAIALVVLLNGLLGFVQEWRAETALDTLRNMLSPQALALRDGQECVIPARELVPGDLIVLAAGDNVPADATLVSALNLSLDESILTGESLPVGKDIETGATSVFTGTAVVEGRGEAVVTATGMQTAFGRIAKLTGSVGARKTHLQVQLGILARQLGLAALATATLIFALGMALGRDPVEMVMTGLSLAVAVVPEGLPAVVTVTLALGAAAMVRQKALVRRLQAVETLGAASVICTDKTGTLTENKMTATLVWTSGARYVVTGTGYDPTGHIARDGNRVRAQDDPVLGRLLRTAIVCSHARLRRDGTAWIMTGEPTEGALVTLAYKGWAEVPKPGDVLAENPFSSDRKRMSVLARHGAKHALFVKGAPEEVLEHCSHAESGDGFRPLDRGERDAIRTAYRDLAAQGLRVIALAMREAAPGDTTEEDLVFLGLVGLIDPPRAEVKSAIEATGSAGIRVIMITGDSPVTATAIASRIGLPVSTTITGQDLEALDDSALGAALREQVLFARTRPDHKLRIVSALQADGQIVAMTGDGVNDAPALKQADIGISMGQRGTDVAKDASDLVLLDDNFATIVRAIREGRRQFDNVQKFVRYLLTSNAGEVIALVANLLIGGPLIFLATQILWMNLVTDSATAIALGLEKSEPGQMQRPPRQRGAPVIGGTGVLIIGVFGLYTGLSSLWIFYHFMPLGEDLARTIAFTAMVVFEKVSVFAFRSLRQPCWRIGWFSNPLLLGAFTLSLLAQVAAVYWPPLQVLLRTVPLGAEHWALIGAFALPVILAPELAKSLPWRRLRSARA